MPTDSELLAPWIDTFKQVGANFGFDPGVIAAIGFHESGLTHGAGYNPPGDAWGLHADGHGHGLFGIDDRWWKDWIAHSDCSAYAQTKFLCALMASNRASLMRAPISIPPDLLPRAVIAAWNCGPHHVRVAIMQNQDVDIYTANKNYSAQVLAKAAQLRPLITPPATSNP